jgi:choline dehydrogenase-like flavoprotein
VPRPDLLSGIGPHDDLEQLGIYTVVNLPGVVRNLQDHILLTGLCFEPKQPLPPPKHNLAGSIAFSKSRSELGVPDLMVLPLQVPFVSDEIRAPYPIPPNAFTFLPALVRPQSRGYLQRPHHHDRGVCVKAAGGSLSGSRNGTTYGCKEALVTFKANPSGAQIAQAVGPLRRALVGRRGHAARAP